MRFAALVNKVRFPHDQDNWVGAREVYRMATQGSARVLGWQTTSARWRRAKG